MYSSYLNLKTWAKDAVSFYNFDWSILLIWSDVCLCGTKGTIYTVWKQYSTIYWLGLIVLKWLMNTENKHHQFDHQYGTRRCMLQCSSSVSLHSAFYLTAPDLFDSWHSLKCSESSDMPGKVVFSHFKENAYFALYIILYIISIPFSILLYAFALS